MRWDGSFGVLRTVFVRVAMCYVRARSAAEHFHCFGAVALARGGALRCDLVDAREVLPCERDVDRADVFLEKLAALGTRDRHHVVPLRHHPRERELRRRAPLLGRERLDVAYELEILLEVRALKARRASAKIIGAEVFDALVGAGEKAAAER